MPLDSIEILLIDVTGQWLRILGISFVLVDQELRFKVVHALQATMLEPPLNFLSAHGIVLLDSLLHLDFHFKYLLVVLCAEFLLDGLHLGEEHFILVQ